MVNRGGRIVWAMRADHPVCARETYTRVQLGFDQKVIRALSRIVLACREPTAFPKLPSARLVTQFVRLTRLKRLKNSPRICKLAPSLENHGRRLFFASDRSTCAKPGPRKVFRP